MKLSPQSNATRTERSASSRATGRNSCPSDDAPKLRIGSCNPVLPKGRVFMRRNVTTKTDFGKLGLARSHGEQHIGPKRLVTRLDGEHMIGRLHVRVKIPFQDRLQLERETALLDG